MSGPRLTAKEIAAVLAVAGNALAYETFEGDTERKVEAQVKAYESGMEKLRAMLAQRRQRP